VGKELYNKQSQFKMTQYKNYAADLYEIKLTVASRPKDENVEGLELFLQKINALRPVFKSELNNLSQEYIEANPLITTQGKDDLKIVNERLVKKLQALVNHIRTKIGRLRLKI
jgi:hypothetical protein